MTLTIDLTPEEEARLNAQAKAQGLDMTTLVHHWIARLPETPSQERATIGAQILAEWEEEGVLGSYGDPNLDSPELARELRRKSEMRGTGA